MIPLTHPWFPVRSQWGCFIIHPYLSRSKVCALEILLVVAFSFLLSAYLSMAQMGYQRCHRLLRCRWCQLVQHMSWSAGECWCLVSYQISRLVYIYKYIRVHSMSSAWSFQANRVLQNFYMPCTWFIDIKFAAGHLLSCANYFSSCETEQNKTSPWFRPHLGNIWPTEFCQNVGVQSHRTHSSLRHCHDQSSVAVAWLPY